MGRLRTVSPLMGVVLLLCYITNISIAQGIDYITSVDWSHDGQRIAIGYGSGSMEILDATGNTLQSFSFDDMIRSVAWNPTDSTSLMVTVDTSESTGRSFLYFYSTNSAAISYSSEFTLSIAGASWSADGSRVAVSLNTPRRSFQAGGIVILDASTGTEIRRIIAKGGTEANLDDIDWSPDGTKVVGSNQENVIVWEARTGSEILELTGHNEFLSDVAWSYDGNYIASSAENIRIWDADTGILIRTIEQIDLIPGEIAWAPTGNALAVIDSSKFIRVFDTQNGDLLQVIPSSNVVSNLILDLSWNPNGSEIIYSELVHDGQPNQIRFITVDDAG